MYRNSFELHYESSQDDYDAKNKYCQGGNAECNEYSEKIYQKKPYSVEIDDQATEEFYKQSKNCAYNQQAYDRCCQYSTSDEIQECECDDAAYDQRIMYAAEDDDDRSQYSRQSDRRFKPYLVSSTQSCGPYLNNPTDQQYDQCSKNIKQEMNECVKNTTNEARVYFEDECDGYVHETREYYDDRGPYLEESYVRCESRTQLYEYPDQAHQRFVPKMKLVQPNTSKYSEQEEYSYSEDRPNERLQYVVDYNDQCCQYPENEVRSRCQYTEDVNEGYHYPEDYQQQYSEVDCEETCQYPKEAYANPEDDYNHSDQYPNKAYEPCDARENYYETTTRVNKPYAQFQPIYEATCKENSRCSGNSKQGYTPKQESSVVEQNQCYYKPYYECDRTYQDEERSSNYAESVAPLRTPKCEQTSDKQPTQNSEDTRDKSDPYLVCSDRCLDGNSKQEYDEFLKGFMHEYERHTDCLGNICDECMEICESCEKIRQKYGPYLSPEGGDQQIECDCSLCKRSKQDPDSSNVACKRTSGSLSDHYKQYLSDFYDRCNKVKRKINQYMQKVNDHCNRYLTNLWGTFSQKPIDAPVKHEPGSVESFDTCDQYSENTDPDRQHFETVDERDYLGEYENYDTYEPFSEEMKLKFNEYLKEASEQTKQFLEDFCKQHNLSSVIDPDIKNRPRACQSSESVSNTGGKYCFVEGYRSDTSARCSSSNAGDGVDSSAGNIVEKRTPIIDECSAYKSKYFDQIPALCNTDSRVSCISSEHLCYEIKFNYKQYMDDLFLRFKLSDIKERLLISKFDEFRKTLREHQRSQQCRMCLQGSCA